MQPRSGVIRTGSRGSLASHRAPPDIWFIEENSTFFPLRLTYRKKKGHSRKIKLTQSPQAAGVDYITAPWFQKVMYGRPEFLWFPILLMSLPVPCPLLPVYHPATYVSDSPRGMCSSSTWIMWGASAYTAASLLHKILALHDPRLPPMTYSPYNVCRAKILGTAPAIINALDGRSKTTKCTVSAAEENAEVKQEQR